LDVATLLGATDTKNAQQEEISDVNLQRSLRMLEAKIIGPQLRQTPWDES